MDKEEDEEKEEVECVDVDVGVGVDVMTRSLVMPASCSTSQTPITCNKPRYLSTSGRSKHPLASKCMPSFSFADI